MFDRHAGDYCCKGHCGYHVHYCYHLKQRQQDGLQVTQVEINSEIAARADRRASAHHSPIQDP
jgi:hypothetical protein